MKNRRIPPQRALVSDTVYFVSMSNCIVNITPTRVTYNTTPVSSTKTHPSRQQCLKFITRSKTTSMPVVCHLKCSATNLFRPGLYHTASIAWTLHLGTLKCDLRPDVSGIVMVQRMAINRLARQN